MEAFRNTWSSLSEVPTKSRGWRTIEEGLMVQREQGLRRAVFEPQFTEPDRILTEELKEQVDQQGPRGWCRSIVTLLNPLVGQVFCFFF